MKSCSWTTFAAGKRRSLAGFRSPELARRHAQDHFFAPRERWSELGPKRSPASYKQRLEAGEPEQKVLDEAAGDYLDLIRRGFDGSAAVTTNIGTYYDGCRACPCLWAATPTGIFCAFNDRSGLSDLRTAYRPLPCVVRGPLSTRHFADEARRRVLRGFQ